MWGALIGDMVGAGFVGKLNTDYRFELSESLHDPTAITALITAAEELTCYGFKPAEGKIASALAARELAGRQKTYLLRAPELADDPRKKWIASATMRRCIIPADFSPLLGVPFAYSCEDIEDAVGCAELACAYISNCTESVRAAKAGAAAVFAALHGVGKDEIAEVCEPFCGIDLTTGYEEMQERLLIDGGATDFVQGAFAAVRRAYDLDSAVRFAAALGRGAPSVCALAGAMAEAAGGGIDSRLVGKARERLDAATLRTVERFTEIWKKDA